AAPAVGVDSGYRPPVAAPVADPFRPPSNAYGPGNRGLDYATTPGAEVKAAADGDVVFAGQVGGTLHVVVLHGDGIRTSYSFLSSIGVHRGDSVRQGQVLGTAGTQRFHFGARAGDAYLDPALLFSTGSPEVHLVPDSERRPQSEAHERSGLLGVLAGGFGSSGAGTGGGAAIFRLNTAALGYAASDVYRFSYRGGTAAENPYGKADTEIDIRTSGARLRALLERLQYEHPGVTVDI